MSVYNEMNKKTQDAIQNAFIDLLLEKDFSKITIREIADYAQVNRGTVYFHYEDKFDLLAKIEEQLIIRLAETIEHLSPSVVLQEAHDGEYPTFRKVYFNILNPIKKFLKPYSLLIVMLHLLGPYANFLSINFYQNLRMKIFQQIKLQKNM